MISDELIEEIRKDEGHKLVHLRVEKPKIPELGPYVDELPLRDEVREALKRNGIVRLFKFQWEAIEKILNEKSLVIVAGTGAGKTEAFLIPILDYIARRPYEGLVAMLIYPTKALARDQLEKILRYTHAMFGVRAMVYDGDTPPRERRLLYEQPPQILITNPDMLHIVMQEVSQFKRLIRRLRFVVLDELHAYQGVFGAHVSYVMRRLSRMASEDMIFIGSSATIGNPMELGNTIFDREVEVVRERSGRRSQVFHMMIRPVTRSVFSEAIVLVKIATDRGKKTIVFADSHRAVEVVKRIADEQKVKLEVHRAGLPPEHRKKVEEALKKGELRAVAATPTLELGIDIGDLDAVILLGVPPTYTKYVQRTGRCGRRGEEAYVMMILGDDPISNFYENHPEEFYGAAPDDVVIDPTNEEVAKIQLLAMSRDKPLQLGELKEHEKEVLKRLLSEGLLRQRGKWFLPTRSGIKLCRERRSLRATGDIVLIVDERGNVIGEREMPMALRELHPGAIYLHGGRVYEVLELKGRRAMVREVPKTIRIYTKALYSGDVEGYVELDNRTSREGIPIKYLKLDIKEEVYGFIIKDYFSDEVLAEKFLDEPVSYRFTTKGILMKLPLPEDMTLEDRIEAIHAIEHALIVAAQTVIGASPTELGGLSFPSGHIIIYDGSPGGSGLSLQVFKRLEKCLSRAREIMMRCRCLDGCPKCIYSPYCGNRNRYLSRVKALRVLSHIVPLKELEEPWGEPVA
ncbi:MAG: hypothetical protein DRN15_03940 [Thermoprotei archaeon]|nr:MAG: hypothetical protein DRN15_03940 [Thermoprotei archaeon]